MRVAGLQDSVGADGTVPGTVPGRAARRLRSKAIRPSLLPAHDGTRQARAARSSSSFGLKPTSGQASGWGLRNSRIRHRPDCPGGAESY